MRPANLLHKCWNMMEDQRMETLCVEEVPRIGNYFGTAVANICLLGGNLPLEQTWLMLAGREYLPKAVRRQSYIMFDQWCFDQGINDGATTWYNLMQDFKAAATHQEIMNAVCAGYDFIQEVRATLPKDDSHDEMDDPDDEDADPAEKARPRGDILDLFDENPPSPPKDAKPSDEEGDSDGGEGDSETGNDDSEGDDDGDSGDSTGDSADDPGDTAGDGGTPGDEVGKEGSEKAQGDGEDGGSSTSKSAGDDREGRPPSVGTGEGAEKQHEPQTFEDMLRDMLDNCTQEMRQDDDVNEVARDVYNNMGTGDELGLTEYPNEPEAMPADMVTRALATAVGIEVALNSFVTQSAPIWKPRQEVGVIDALHYRTKSVGDRDYRRELEDRGNTGLDVHVSMLCDVSGSMGCVRSNQQLPIHALSEALYATAVACQNLHIGSTFTIWSDRQQNYRVWPNGDPQPVLWPSMGGTNPNEALDDLDTHNPEKAGSHLVLIFTDGAWSRDFPTLRRWHVPGRTIVLVRYGQYDGAVQKDMGADKHINIEAVDQLPNELTNALIEVLGRAS